MTTVELKQWWQREVLPHIYSFEVQKNNQEAAVFTGCWLLMGYVSVYPVAKIINVALSVSMARVASILAGLFVATLFFVIYHKRMLQDVRLLAIAGGNALVTLLIGLYISYWLALPVGMLCIWWLLMQGQGNSIQLPSFSKATEKCSCGANIPTNSKFCPECGKQKVVVVTPRSTVGNVCAGCGNKMPLDKKFCSFCGMKKQDTEPTVPIVTTVEQQERVPLEQPPLGNIAGAGSELLEEQKQEDLSPTTSVDVGTNEKSFVGKNACLNCGRSMDSDSKACEHCGTPKVGILGTGTLMASAATNEISKEINPPTDPEPIMEPTKAPMEQEVKVATEVPTIVRCGVCGNEMAVEKKFCSNCGAKRATEAVTQPAVAENICKHCGHLKAAQAKFCSECGQP